ncbi:MAG TPA: YIP1 family protein [Pyrinomonadaceae bacterium]|nr:YIP1 family protein [Pyrinomonadaceae bacterium]
MSDPNQEFHAPPPAPAEQKAPRASHLLPYGIGLFVIGLIALILGIVKVLPGGIGTGLAFAFWGILLFAFSFIPLPKTKGGEEPPMSGPAKLAGIFFEPTRVFRDLRANPRWLAAFLTIAILNAIYGAAFVQRVTATRIVDFTMEKMESSPIKPPPDRMADTKEQMLQSMTQTSQRVQTAAKSFVGVFVLIAFVAALCLLAVMAFGGSMNFWQAFAAVAYGYVPIAVVSRVASLIILYLKSPEDIHPVLDQETLLHYDNLGVLFSPAEHPALYVLGSVIGLLSFYGLWLRAKGLQNAGYKVSSSAAWGTAITLWVLALLLGMVFATLFAGFMS